MANKTYIANDDADKLAALKRFVNEGVVNEAHKKLVKKHAIAKWTHGMWVITPEAKAHAEKLGYL